MIRYHLRGAQITFQKGRESIKSTEDQLNKDFVGKSLENDKRSVTGFGF